MSAQSTWDADAAARRCQAAPWSGTAWRAHRRRYSATDPGGSLRLSGRYNRGLDYFPPDQAWPSLYLALSRDICLAEIMRHLTPDSLPALRDYRLSELRVTLGAVLDARDLETLAIECEALCHDTDYSIPQALAAAARARGVGAMLVPSATRLGDTLIVFVAQLRAGSTLELRSAVDPRLYVPRP